MERVQALGYGNDTEAAQLLMLNQVIRRVTNARRWTFLLNTITNKVTAAGTETVALDAAIADTIRVDGVEATQPGGEPFELEYIEPPLIRQYIHDNSATGQPLYWSRIGQNLLFYPIPDAAYKLKIYTVANAVNLTSKAENVPIPDSHIDILVYGMIMQLSYRERDWDGHNFARQMYAELFTEMLAQYGMKQRGQSTHVTSSGSWEQYDIEDAWPISVIS